MPLSPGVTTVCTLSTTQGIRPRVSGATITDPDHVATAKELRGSFNAARAAAAARKTSRAHGDGHVVALRALPDYDDLFGVDFHHAPDLQGVHTS